MAYVQKSKIAQAQGPMPSPMKARRMGEKGVLTDKDLQDEGAQEQEPAGSPAEDAEGEDAAPTQSKPKTLEQKAKEPVSGAEVDPATAKPVSSIKVRSTDDLRSIYKKKFGKSQSVLAEGKSTAGKNESYKTIKPQN